MRAEISKLQRRLETTTLYVTHDQVEAMTMGHRIAIIKDGDLQQVGTPLEVYEDPENVFVATFIGTPPMNFLTAELADSGSRVKNAHMQVPVPESMRAATSGKDGMRVLVGVRPENLVDAASGRGETAPVRMDVEVIEPLGHEILVHGTIGDDRLVAKGNPHRPPSLGEPLDLVVELERMRIFDPETELRLQA